MKSILRTPGFTVIEVTVAISLSLILAAVALPSLFPLKQRNELQQATTQLAQDIQKQQALARTYNMTRTVQLGANSQSYQVTDPNCTTGACATLTVNLPSQTQIGSITGTTTITFSPPYGTTTITLTKIQVASLANTTLSTRSVNIVGSMGKVIIQ